MWSVLYVFRAESFGFFWHPKHWNNAALGCATLQKQQVAEGWAELIAPLRESKHTCCLNKPCSDWKDEWQITQTTRLLYKLPFWRKPFKNVSGSLGDKASFALQNPASIQQLLKLSVWAFFNPFLFLDLQCSEWASGDDGATHFILFCICLGPAFSPCLFFPLLLFSSISCVALVHPSRWKFLTSGCESLQCQIIGIPLPSPDCQAFFCTSKASALLQPPIADMRIQLTCEPLHRRRSDAEQNTPRPPHQSD